MTTADNSVTGRLSTLLAQFGEAMGIPGLTFDQNRNCCLVFDRQILVNIAHQERLNRVVLFSYLGRTPQNVAGRSLLPLLEGNFFWQGTDGATLSIEAASRSIVLMRELPTDKLDLPLLQEGVERFVNVAEHWIGRLRCEDDDDDRPNERHRPLGMRV
ncbi:type III secretion system chaperone [Telmatospirillum sp. J64-1]|uniref:type III secretion system chaperone n=1 Tax=Telmatospirillum sp. J64-1 TaxID=2502183 RepID=UPI00115F4D1B|nr:type III secretion system chaperone [Telmatospirillum sp. J64-1]